MNFVTKCKRRFWYRTHQLLRHHWSKMDWSTPATGTDVMLIFWNFIRGLLLSCNKTWRDIRSPSWQTHGRMNAAAAEKNTCVIDVGCRMCPIKRNGEGKNRSSLIRNPYGMFSTAGYVRMTHCVKLWVDHICGISSGMCDLRYFRKGLSVCSCGPTAVY